MEVMTMEEYKKWVQEVGIELTHNVCKKCDRRTNHCISCQNDHFQPERLSEKTPKGEAIV